MRNSAKIVLASSSPRRRELLELLNVDFTVVSSNADESIEKPVPPVEYVETLAVRKAKAVAESLATSEDEQDVLVVGADTIVTTDGRILGKPKDAADAAAMLRSLQGRTHTVYTGLCVYQVADGVKRSGFSATSVTMRPLTQRQIEDYIATEEPFDKAGAYGIQGLGSTLVTRIHGDYFTVVGLPLYLLYDYLGQFGVPVY